MKRGLSDGFDKVVLKGSANADRWVTDYGDQRDLHGCPVPSDVGAVLDLIHFVDLINGDVAEEANGEFLSFRRSLWRGVLQRMLILTLTPTTRVLSTTPRSWSGLWLKSSGALSLRRDGYKAPAACGCTSTPYR